MTKWIAKKYPEVKGANHFHIKGDERAFAIEMERNWILDSGASDRVLSRKEMLPREARSMCTLDKPPMYNTENGEVTSSKVAEVWIRALGVHMWAMVFNQRTPCLLSMGKLVEELGAFIASESDDLILNSNDKQKSVPSLQNAPTIALEGGTQSDIGDADDEDSMEKRTAALASTRADDPTAALASPRFICNSLSFRRSRRAGRKAKGTQQEK